MATYDVAVIGAGPGGYVAAIRCAQLGLKTVCIEKEKTLGGTCLNVGCIPSKALLNSSEKFHWLQHEAANHGITSKDVSLDFKKMLLRKEEIVQGLCGGVKLLFKHHKVESIEGMATLESPTKIRVGKKTIEAKSMIIATGSTPVELPFLPFDEKKIVSSTGALSLPKVPKKLAVVGAGVIGVELASVYQRLGAEVVLFEMLDHICSGMDPAICKGLQKMLESQGLRFHLSAKVEGIKKGKLQTSVGEFPQDVILVAVGRRPFTEGLGLETAGITVNHQGQVEVDRQFRTSVPNVYAIGDIIDGPMLAHKASDEGMAVAEILAGNQPLVNYMTIPNVIYTHPEAASVGITELEGKELGLSLAIGTSHFNANARARCTGDSGGFVKVIAEKLSGKLLGVHILGPHASELIAEGVVAIEKSATLKELAFLSHAHPTLSETMKEACLAAYS